MSIYHRVKSERKFNWNYHYMSIYHIHCSYWFYTAYFVTFPEVTIVRYCKKWLFLKYVRKARRAEFLEMLETAIFFQKFSRVNGFLLSPKWVICPHPPRQNNFQNSPALDTSATTLACIFSSILKHSYGNQKNSIIKGWKQIEIAIFFFCHQKY